jgi:two-component system, response regulator PdtaR
LIVEDEIIVATDLKQQLEHMGYKVVGIANKGKYAIKKCKETNPDLILMDIILKGDIDGIETVKQIQTFQNIPIIYLTAYSDQKLFERAKETNPVNYLIKPYDDIELNSAIRKAIKTPKVS